MVPELGQFMSDQFLLDNSLRKDAGLMENNIVKLWLEETAPQFDPCPIRPDNLKATLNHLKSQVTSRSFNTGMVVTELDPDATTRQSKTYLTEDIEYEKNVNKMIFNLIRCGKLADAIKFCQSINQHWKAATLRGGEPASDLLIDEGSTEFIAGNQNYVLWRATCFALSQCPSLDEYERATYAALCGDLNGIEPVCKTWEDFMWANFTCMIHRKGQHYVLEQSQKLLAYDEISLSLPTYSSSEDQVLEKLEKHSSKTVKTTSHDIFHQIQTHLITNTLGELFQSLQNTWKGLTVEKLDEPNRHAIRFVAHFILLLRHLEMEPEQEIGDSLLQIYIDLLQVEKKWDLIALFYEDMSVENQLTGYSSFLQGVKSDRHRYYFIGKEARLNMLDITINTVKQLFVQNHIFDGQINNVSDVELTALTAPVPDADKKNIETLEWLVYNTSELKYLVEYINTLTRHFLVIGHINSIKALLERYSIMVFDIDIQSTMDLFDEKSQYQSLLNCIDLYNQWALLKTNCPSEEFKSEYDNWAQEMIKLTDTATESIFDLLQCPVFGCQTTERFEDIRFQHIRAIYVPKLVIWIHTMYFETRKINPQNLKKSLDLATLVSAAVEDGEELACSFKRAGSLEYFLGLMQKSAMELLYLSDTSFIN
ncbi:nuclear pore protein 84/107 [Globomyces pollinis-pini]|nr:nuclear pore protein 84/107 [Globomyces pollinis-pini]